MDTDSAITAVSAAADTANAAASSSESTFVLFSLLAALLAAVSFSILAWVVLERILRIRVESKEFAVRIPLLFRLFLPLTGNFRPLMRLKSMQTQVNAVDSRLVMAGLDQEIQPEEFVGLQVLYAIIFGSAGITCMMLMHTRFFIICGFLLVLFGLLYPTLWLRSTIKARHRSIQRALPSVLDLLTLSVEAGRDFLTALREILRHRPRDPLGEELERVFRETQLGKQRRQALRDMAARCRQNDLNTVVETLAQADELGVSIGHILRVLGDQMRQKRFQYAEKLANEAPVKLMFPLICFIFPAVILMIFVPVLLRWNLGAFLQ